MAGKSANSSGAKNWSPGSPSTRYNVSGKNREYYTFENAPGLGAYATGGTIIDGGDGYIYHIFTGNGTFTVNRPPAAIDSVDYLIVGGGGANAGNIIHAGGGGGGGFRFGNIAVSNTPGSYPIVVGAGGGFTPVPSSASTRSGSSSSAFGLTANGGGGGGSTPPTGAAPSVPANGAPGGSGGGGAGNPAVLTLATSVSTIPRQGYSGGAGPILGTSAGGGGAGGNGGTGNPPATAGVGGPGRIDPNFPSTIVRRAIPTANIPFWEPLVGPSGYAAGGPGGGPINPTARSAPANSGYGGNATANNGGSGIVCIRYRKTAGYSRATGGTIEPNTHPEHPGVWRHIFTSPGTFTVTDPTLQWIDYLAVGGGGGGGQGGGGGAGGFVTSIETSTTTPNPSPFDSPPLGHAWNSGTPVRVGRQMPVAASSYPVSIGAGGAWSANGNPTTIGTPGASQIIAIGGGYGGTLGLAAGPGGSGGGGSTPSLYTGPSPVPGAVGTLPQGNPGGAGVYLAPPVPFGFTHGGGGGAGGAGSNGSVAGYSGGMGGSGWYSVLSPSAYGTPGPLTPTALYRYFAGGGGGAGGGGPAPGAPGAGLNGGGNGAPSPSGTATAATANTGGGGGGGAPGGSAGGSGIVIIQYPE
jgi:hypothetical protein